MYKCSNTTTQLAKALKMSKKHIRWAWSWSGDQWDWRRDTSDLGPSSRTHEDLQDPYKKKINKMKTMPFSCAIVANYGWSTHFDWLTSIKEPILEVVNEMCSSPMTISSSYELKEWNKSRWVIVRLQTKALTKVSLWTTCWVDKHVVVLTKQIEFSMQLQI